MMVCDVIHLSFFNVLRFHFTPAVWLSLCIASLASSIRTIVFLGSQQLAELALICHTDEWITRKSFPCSFDYLPIVCKSSTVFFLCSTTNFSVPCSQFWIDLDRISAWTSVAVSYPLLQYQIRSRSLLHQHLKDTDSSGCVQTLISWFADVPKLRWSVWGQNWGRLRRNGVITRKNVSVIRRKSLNVAVRLIACRDKSGEQKWFVFRNFHCFITAVLQIGRFLKLEQNQWSYYIGFSFVQEINDLKAVEDTPPIDVVTLVSRAVTNLVLWL